MSCLKQKYFSLSDEDGNIVEEITYDGHYGKVVKHTIKEENFTMNPYGYTSRELDKEDLYYYRARYYDPTTQQFLSPDPIEFKAGDFNFYRYVGGNCVNFRDPTGLNRQEHITDMVDSLINNPTVPNQYIIKLQYLLRNNKILYVEQSLRRTTAGMQNVFGTASLRTGKVRMTSRCWTHWEQESKPDMIDTQIQKTLLHEIKHLLLNTTDHPIPEGGISFDDDFEDILFDYWKIF